MNDDVLRKIRAALEKGPRAAAPEERAKTSSHEGRLFPSDLDEPSRIALFAERAESSGARVHRAGDRAALEAVIEKIVGDGAAVAVAGSCAADLVPRSCTLVEISVPAMDELFRIDAAVTDVDLAVAETGSIVLGASAAHRRLASLVPLVHVALVWPDQIVADLIDWADALPEADDRDAPGGLTLISGPSKTADIEIKLITGVHGPGELHLVIVEDTAGETEAR